MQNIRSSIIFLVLGFWLGASVLIDFVVVPTVFRSGLDFFDAGAVGIALFTKFNFVEIACAITILILVRDRKTLTLAIAGILLVLVSVYAVWLTPKISSLTALWKVSPDGVLGKVDLQQAHQFHHRLYVGLDTLKMILLASLIGLEIRKKS